jgi:hypothetical protein
VARTIIWKLIGSALILTLALFATEEASSDFQAMVFLVVLIGYQRLTGQILEDRHANRVRCLRTETWFHRIDSAIRGTQPGAAGAASMVAGVGNERELEELKEAVERLAATGNVERAISAATEMLLVLAAVSVVLR